MKKFIVIVFLAISGCNADDSSLVPAEFYTKLKNTPNAVVLDVRSEEEVGAGALPGAQNIVYTDSFAEKLDGLSKEIPVFVYCAKGVRSKKAADIMRERGFKEVYQMRGGLDAWKEANLPMN